MNLPSVLATRSESKCELCFREDKLSAYTVSPRSDDHTDNQIVCCDICLAQLQDIDKLDPNHWRCLNESMWSQVPSVQVVVHRILSSLSDHAWAADLKSQLYLDEETIEWAEQGANSPVIVHKDSNGKVLSAGDTVTLIQDLNVKGASFTAKRGTAVRRIRLVHDKAEQIEGKIDGQQIVILTKYVKKS